MLLVEGFLCDKIFKKKGCVKKVDGDPKPRLIKIIKYGKVHLFDSKVKYFSTFQMSGFVSYEKRIS